MLQLRIVPSKPVMILEGKKKNLIATDFHIGFESYLTLNEIFIGKNSSIRETIDELSNIIDSEKPDSFILLGDIKSGIKTISKSEWDEVPLFFESLVKKCEVVLIPGNHDANIQRLVPNNISMISSTGIVLENIYHGSCTSSIFSRGFCIKWTKSVDFNKDRKTKFVSRQIRRD